MSLRCPYCRDELRAAAARVTCPRCGTAAHRDCWRLHGGCSIFACAERPPAAGPVRAGWAAWVEEAAPWLELGEALLARGGWDVPAAPPPEDEGSGRGSSSSGSPSSRAA